MNTDSVLGKVEPKANDDRVHAEKQLREQESTEDTLAALFDLGDSQLSEKKLEEILWAIFTGNRQADPP